MDKHLICYVLLTGFLLGLYRGRLALWKDDDPTPVQIFPYSAITLPPDVRQALEQGIEIETEADLQQLLENYLS